MSPLKDIIAYIIKQYPEKDDLSKARLTKLVYLVDWHSSVINGEQITSIKWFFNHFGPYVEDVMTEVMFNPQLFCKKDDRNMLGKEKTIISLKDNCYEPNISENEAKSINAVIKATSNMSFTKFIETVYSTYPIAFGEQYEILDLKKLASEYNDLVREK